MAKQIAKAQDFPILVNDACRLYAADQGGNGTMPAGWKRIAVRQWEYVRLGYDYASPWDVYPFAQG